MEHARSYSQREHELIPGFLRGYRMWNWYPHDGWLAPSLNFSGRLTSLARMHTWTPGVQAALCLPNRNHSAPLRHCTCGFYATYAGMPHDYSGIFEGSIRATGRVILGQRGFRAQTAEVEALCFGYGPSAGRLAMSRYLATVGYNVKPDFDVDAAAKALSEMYQVPFFANRQELLKAFPPQDVSHLIETEEIGASKPFEWSALLQSGAPIVSGGAGPFAGTFTVIDANGNLAVYASNGVMTFIAAPPKGPPGADPASG